MQVVTTGLAGLTVSPVVISENQRSASFTVTAAADAALGARQVLLVAGNDYVLGTPSSVTVTVEAAVDQLPVVTLVGGNTTLAQGSATTYVVTLDRPAPADLPVQVVTTGLAGLTVSPVVISENQRSASFTVTAAANAALGARQVLLVAGNDYVLGTPSSVTVTVVTAAEAGLLPLADLTGSSTTLLADGQTVLAVTLNEPQLGAVTVNLIATGDVSSFSVPASVTVDPGATTEPFEIRALADAQVGASIEVRLVPGTGYVLGDNEPRIFTVSSDPGTGAIVDLREFDATLRPGRVTTFAITLREPTAVELTVNLSTTGNVTQFEFPTQVVVPPNVTSVPFDVRALDSAQDASAIYIRLVAGSGYRIGVDGPITVTVDRDGGGVDPGSVASVELLANSLQLPSVGVPPVILTAFVKDSNNILLEGVPVQFSANNAGTLRVTRPVTDGSGTAQAELTSQNERENRQITVNAAAGGENANITIRVVGTNITITGRNSGSVGDVIFLTVTLRDSASNPLVGKILSLAFDTNEASLPLGPTVETGLNGQATVRVSLEGAGTPRLTVSGAGALATFDFVISPDVLEFVVPNSNDEIDLNTPEPVTVRYTVAGVPAPNEPINFTATRGALTSFTELTDVAGEATVFVESVDAGPSVITAVVDGDRASAEVGVLFVATTPATMVLQASPAVIGTNGIGESDQQSQIIATVRDAANNLVKNQTVIFSLQDITGGTISPASAVTDVFGQASTTYTAGSVPSAQDGVTVTAALLNDPLINSEVKLTTARRALFITLGTGNQIEKPDAVRYVKPYGVLVTDSVGNPVSNVAVSLAVWPTHYHKGFWTLVPRGSDLVWEPTETLDPALFPQGCQNEDRNRDGILNIPPDVDFNNNGQLDPGTVASLTLSNVTTDETGFADFGISYFQEYAQWVSVELTARALVDGSESIEQAFFRLPILASDTTDDKVSPPGNPSPFGISNTCADEL